MRSLCRAKEKHIKLLLTRLVVVQGERERNLRSDARLSREAGDVGLVWLPARQLRLPRPYSSFTAFPNRCVPLIV
jgi:hypothetical protein